MASPRTLRALAARPTKNDPNRSYHAQTIRLPEPEPPPLANTAKEREALNRYFVDSGLQQVFKRLGAAHTAIVSTIVGEDRLNIIVTTADTQRAHTVEVPGKEVNRLVADFRRGLTDPKVDPRPAG